jgi:hypothetical protein
MSQPQTVFILTNSGVFQTTIQLSSFTPSSIINPVSVGCLTHDIRISDFWVGDVTDQFWHLFNRGWTTATSQYVRAVQTDQMTGDAFFLTPFKYIAPAGTSPYQVLSGYVTKYSASTRTAATFPILIGSKIVDLTYALDMKIDSARRKIWVLEAVSSTIYRANIDTGIVDLSISLVDMICPCSMTVDLSNGNAYVRTLNQSLTSDGEPISSNSEEEISYYETVYVVNDNGIAAAVETTSAIAYPSSVTSPTSKNLAAMAQSNSPISLPTSDSMKFDSKRENLWWLSKSEECIIFRMNAKDYTMTSLSLKSAMDKVSSVTINNADGSVLVCGQTGITGCILIINETCSSFETHYFYSPVNNAIIMDSELGNNLPFYWNSVFSPTGKTIGTSNDTGSSSSSLSSESSPSSDIEEFTNLTKIDYTIIAEPIQEVPESDSSEDDGHPETTPSPYVNVGIWGQDGLGMTSTRVWTVKGQSSNINAITNAVSIPRFSWGISATSAKPAIVTTIANGDLLEFQYDQSTNEITQINSCQSPVNGKILGLSVINGDGNVYVSGNGSISMINVDPTNPGKYENLSSMSSSSSESSALSTGQKLNYSLKVVAAMGDTGIGGLSVQFHDQAGNIWTLSNQDGALTMFASINGSQTAYGPFPMPFKAVWSESLAGVVVACQYSVNFLAVPQNTQKIIYGTPNCAINDICERNGDIGIALTKANGTDGIVKVLSSDLYSNKLLYVTTGQFPSKVCFASTGIIIVALERLVNGLPVTNFVTIGFGKTPGQQSVDFDGSVQSLFYDENFNVVFAAFSSGDVAVVSPSVSGITTATIVGSAGSEITFAGGSLVSALTTESVTQKKVRIFVGSIEGSNDRWDSGEVRTSSQEMLYGGGDNLMSGEAYWVSISIKDNFGRWSDPFVRRFVAPWM